MGEAKVEWTEDEFVPIAQEQARREDLAARIANRILFCDTDAFATSLWFERYLDRRSPRVEAVSAGRSYDLTLLTGAKIPFVQDGWRDGERVREAMHHRFIERLEEEDRPYVLLQGSPEVRLTEAKATSTNSWKVVDASGVASAIPSMVSPIKTAPAHTPRPP